MKHFVESIRAAVAAENWYAATALALTMPDICGRVEWPSEKSQTRYVKWFNAHLAGTYRKMVGPYRQVVQMLTGEDLYALRCAYLHQGDFDLAGQRAARILTRFVFVTPQEKSWVVHLNQFNDTLQLQVSEFAEEMCVAVEIWEQANISNTAHRAAIDAMGTVKVLGSSLSFPM